MKLKVVYIDDEEDLGEIFVDLFSSPQVEIKFFSQPLLAIESIHHESPDLLFLDYRLPNMTGDDIALKLNPSIPKVLISGDLSIKTKYSFSQVFQKPIKVEEIQKIIDEYLKKKIS